MLQLVALLGHIVVLIYDVIVLIRVQQLRDVFTVYAGFKNKHEFYCSHRRYSLYGPTLWTILLN
jgi:hypothetical protein